MEGMIRTPFVLAQNGPGDYHGMLGLHRDNGQENGNYYHRVHIRVKIRYIQI